MEKKYTLLLLIIIVLIVLTSIGGYIILNNKSNVFKQVQLEPTQTPTETPLPQPTEKIISGQFFLTVDSPTEEQTFNSSEVIVTGRTVAGAEVFINEKPAQVDSFGNFNLQITLEEGENYILVSAGNEESDAEVEKMIYYER